MFYCFDDGNRTENSAVITLAYDTKEEVIEWMLDIQLGRNVILNCLSDCYI